MPFAELAKSEAEKEEGGKQNRHWSALAPPQLLGEDSPTLLRLISNLTSSMKASLTSLGAATGCVPSAVSTLNHSFYHTGSRP